MKKSELLVLALFFIIMSATILSSEWQYLSQIQPTGVRSFSDHVRRFGKPRFVYKVSQGGKTFFELQGFPGGTRPLFSFPSSPPSYIYDTTGHLIDWCPDPGDSSTHSTKWPRTSCIPVDINTLPEPFLVSGQTPGD